MVRFILLGICVFVAVARPDQARLLLTNEDVIQLLRAGLEETLVLQAVDIHDSRFDLSPEGLANLRKANVGERVIAAMVSKSRSIAEGHQMRPTLLEPGVYVKRGETYADLPIEAVNWRATPAIGQVIGSTLGRISLTGRVANAHSGLRLTGPIELLVVCPPGLSASEYRLLRAEGNDDWRDFRIGAAFSGGTLLGLGTAEKYEVTFDVDKSFDLGVRFRLGILRKGEYGLVPPGLIEGGQVTPVGRVYTFTVD